MEEEKTLGLWSWPWQGTGTDSSWLSTNIPRLGGSCEVGQNLMDRTQPVSEQQLLFSAHPCRPIAPCCRPACCVWPARCAKQTRQAGGGCPAQYDLNIITSIGISITLSFDRNVFDRRGLTSLYYLRDVTDFLWPLGVVDDSEAGDG